MTPARRSLIVLAALTTATSLAVLAVAGGDDSARGGGEYVAQSPPASGTTLVESQGANDSDVEGSATESGARRASLRFLELTERVVDMTPEEAADAQRAISTARSAERLAADVETKLRAIQAQVPEGVAVHVAPVAVRSTRLGDGWSVAIWYVQVAVYGGELATEQWTTATYSMVREAGSWRMDDLVSAPGPTPARSATTTATPVADLLSALEGFSDEGVAP
ncbi:MAG: hypothetical protein AB7W59_00455 [Acidimicrobiia bacterium]